MSVAQTDRATRFYLVGCRFESYPTCFSYLRSFVFLIEQFVIDPPWPQRKGGRRSTRPQQGRELDYPTMSIPDIFSLLDDQVLSQAAPIHNVFLWGIDKFLPEGEQELLNRGYRLHARFVWDKENGVAPAFTLRYCHEYLTWFYKPKLLPVNFLYRGKASSIIRAKARQHSRKPDEAYQLIEKLYPSSTKMDVFSREHRIGWEQFGNETNKFRATPSRK